MSFFRDMLHSTKSTHFSQIYYFFIIGKMCFESGWNGFSGWIWPAGRSLEILDVNYEEEWWQHTHCRSPTPSVNDCNLTPSTRTQSSEQEYSYLTTSKRQPSTPYSRNASKAFHKERGYLLSRGRQNMCIHLWQSPRISQKFAGEWKLFL